MRAVFRGDFMADDDSEIAGHITCYGALFAEQVKRAGGWPKKFTFPEPTSDTQREAFRLFAEEVEQTTGVTVKVSWKP
jgi:hypothetical protein